LVREGLATAGPNYGNRFYKKNAAYGRP
jgi:hypothetical protein